MKITAIKAQVRSESRVSVFLDSKYSFSITLDQLLQEKLKKNDEIDENRLKNLKKLSDEGKLKARTMEWLMGRPHSTREFRDYLYRKKADKELIEAWIQEFTERNYLDDNEFASWFADQRRRKNKSNRAITSELYSKGVPKEAINNAMEGLGDEENGSEKDALIKLVNKLSDRPRYQDEKKLITHLLSKGFNYSLIKEVLSSLSSDG